MNKEILRFFLYVITMDIIQMPHLRMYWAPETLVPTVTVLVSTSAEFGPFYVDIHMVDTSAYTQTERATKNKADSMWKLGDLETILSDIFCLYRDCHTT